MNGNIWVILSSLSSFVGVMVTCYMAIRKVHVDTSIRLEILFEKMADLTREVRRHNGFAEKIPVLEEKINNLEKR